MLQLNFKDHYRFQRLFKKSILDFKLKIKHRHNNLT